MGAPSLLNPTPCWRHLFSSTIRGSNQSQILNRIGQDFPKRQPQHRISTVYNHYNHWRRIWYLVNCIFVFVSQHCAPVISAHTLLCSP